MADLKSSEYETFVELQEVLRIGIQSDIETVAARAFSAMLITSENLEELTMQTTAKHTRARSFLGMMGNKIKRDPTNLAKFKGRLDPYVHKDLVKRIDDILKQKNSKPVRKPPVADFSEPGDVFISYKWEEEVKPFADKLAIALEEQGVSCWKDDHIVKEGDDLDERIVAGINRCKVFVPILSVGYVSEGGEQWCQRECKFARKKRKKMVPIRWGNTEIPDTIDFIIGPSIFRGSCSTVSADQYLQEICPVIKQKVQAD